METMLEFFMNLNQSPEGQAFLAHLLINNHNRHQYYEQIQHFNSIANLYNLQTLGIIDLSWQYYAMPRRINLGSRCDGILWNTNHDLYTFIAIQYKYKLNSALEYSELLKLYNKYIDTHVLEIGIDNKQLFLEQLYYFLDHNDYLLLKNKLLIQDYSYVNDNLTEEQKNFLWKVINRYNEEYNLKQHNLLKANHYNIKTYLPLRSGLESVAKLFLHK